jgi:clan AA aspartic protease (TIGR02281 family)
VFYRTIGAFGIAAVALAVGACQQEPQTPAAKGAAAYSRGDYATALAIFRPLAEAGDVTAQFDLGVMYANGQGLVQDYIQALTWYRRAADQRSADAQNNIGNLYRYGRGVPQDKVRAYMWFNLAASALNARDAETGIRNRDVASTEMNGAQIAQGQDLSRRCSRRSFKRCDDLLVGRRSTAAAIAGAQQAAGSNPRLSLSARVPQHVIPLEAKGGTFLVDAVINGATTAKFTLDSGATDVTIPSDVFWSLVANGSIADSDLRGEAVYELADGSRQKSQTFIIHTLAVGNAVAQNVRASVSGDGNTYLLGQSFLRQFKSWSIDNRRGALVIE